MDFNGEKVDVSQLNKILDGINVNEDQLKELEIEEPNYTFEITECNRIANIPKRYENCRFLDYDYGDVGEQVRKYSLKPSDRAMLLFGPTGTGKTSLMCSAMHERAIAGLSGGSYFNNRFLMPTLRTCRSFSAKENEEYFLRRLSSVPFLCIDEVGTATNFKEEAEFMTLIICARYDNKLPTMIATNLDTLNFSLLLCGIDSKEMTKAEAKAIWEREVKCNATLDRFNSIATKLAVISSSHRGE